IQIIPKIENQEGLDNIDEILKISQGIMIARGDIGVEIPTEEVPIAQKMLIEKCNRLGKPVIIATQMLDSMQRNQRSTLAEAGDDPVEAVTTMATIARRTEDALVGRDSFALKAYSNTDMAEAISQSVGHTARNLNIQTIVAATESGHTARMISKYRPKAHIVAVTFSDRQARGLSLSYGVYP